MIDRPAHVRALGAGAAQLSMIALDLANDEEALELAKRVAEQTGRTVMVRDANGEVLGVFRGAAKN